MPRRERRIWCEGLTYFARRESMRRVDRWSHDERFSPSRRDHHESSLATSVTKDPASENIDLTDGQPVASL